MWTNGGEWIAFRKEPMSWALVSGFAVEAAKKVVATRTDMPIDVVAAEVKSRWPGRWKGPFEVGALGVRFWDDTADNPTGCQVKPDGMLCFTGNVPFMKWEHIFGSSWTNEKRALNLGQIAGEIYFDGRSYYQQQGGCWFDKCREDILLELSARGLNTVKQKGQTVSEAARVLHHIQNVNRVHGAAPLIFRPPGVVNVAGYRILNTNSLQPIQPANGHCTPADFPLLWNWQNGFFVPVEGLDPLNHWRNYWLRTYLAVLEHEPLMGQAVFLCGPVNNGKSLWVYRMLAPSLGGRLVNPYLYLTGQTHFTDELFGSPLWAINDEEAPDEPRKRAMQAKIKASVVNPELTYHPKFAKKLSLPWQGRVVVTMNDGPDSVGMLPEVNDETRDKLMFFRTQNYAGIWPENKIIEAQVKHELPYMLGWLTRVWKCPEHVTKGAFPRMGMNSYFDPHLLNLSHRQNHYFVFLEVLGLWAHQAPSFEGKEIWEGNPSTLKAEMHILDSLKEMMREWTSAKVSKALSALARLGGLGVEFVGDEGRLFRLIKAKLPKLPVT